MKSKYYKFILGFMAAFVLGTFLNASASGQVALPVKVVTNRHTLILFSDGTVSGWGAAKEGQLGPVEVTSQNYWHADHRIDISLPQKALDVAAGSDTSYALLADGTVVAWGALFNTNRPVRMNGLSNIKKILAGGNNGIALSNNGTVFTWRIPEIKSQSWAPRQERELNGIIDISESTHYMALDSAGNVWTWGNEIPARMYGVLGRVDNCETPQKVDGISNVISIAAGSGVSAAVKRDGTVWTWGSHYMAGLGNGRDRTSPPVANSSASIFQLKPGIVAGVSNAVSVVSGLSGRFTLVLMADGTVKGWGSNELGQIAIGTKDPLYVLKPMVSKISGVKTLIAAGNNAYAIKRDGTFWVWGDSSSFKLYPSFPVMRLPVQFKVK